MKRFLITLCLLYNILLYASDINGGLFFRSHQQPGTIRTRLILNDGNPIKIGNGRTISFDLMLRKEIVWGYVVRITANTQKSIDLAYLSNKKDDCYPALILNKNQYPITREVKYDEWIPVSIKLLPEDNKIICIFGSIQNNYTFDFSGCKDIIVHFGTSGIRNFQIGDAAPVNIKDIRILDEEDRTIYHWELKQHKDSICYDLMEQCPAIAENPIWLIDRHSFWNQLYEQEYKGYSQVAYNINDNLFYIFDESNSLTTLNPVTRETHTISIKGKSASKKGNQITYDLYREEFISYNIAPKSVSVFSPKDHSWDESPITDTDSHTLSILSHRDTSLITFEEYGYFGHKNTVFRVNLDTYRWDSIRIKEISPRFSTASTTVNNKLYILGEQENKNGQQENVFHNFLDLYEIDLFSLKIKKTWKLKSDVKNENNILLRSNMIYNPHDSCFYAINISKSQKYLVKINLNTEDIEKCSTNIGNEIETEYLFCNLYYSADSTQLYAVFNQKTENDNSKISIYTIDFPPLAIENTIQQIPTQHTKLWIGIGIAVFFILLSGYGLYKYFRFPKNQYSNSTEIKEMGTTAAEEVSKKFDRSKGCISLLGGFNIKDKNGDDITNQFTPILKSLLLIILLYSIKTRQGISSNKIDSILWSDKDEKSARNNRNVSIRKLRILLKKIGDIQIVFENNIWKIIFGNDVFCDYLMMTRFSQNEIFDNYSKEENIYPILELLAFGPLLPNTQAEWIDYFKNEYSNTSLNLLHTLLHSKEFEDKDDVQLFIADTIFLYDIFNEEALKTKCSILYKKNKENIAKDTYDNFCKQYKSLLGTDYKIPFSNIISSNADKIA